MQYNSTTQSIITLLRENNIDYEIFEHEPVTTSEEAAAVRESFSVDQGLKALIIKTYGGSEGHAMIVLPGDQKFAQKKVENALNIDDPEPENLTKSEPRFRAGFRLADPEVIEDVTDGVEIGGIPPFGSLFDLPTYADKQIGGMGKIVFNAGDREVSISISAEEYLKLENLTLVSLCREKFYRYTSEGQGIWSAGKEQLPEDLVDEAWEQRKWMPKPDLSPDSYRFFLTKKGKEKYEGTLLKTHKKYLFNIECHTVQSSEIGEIVYRDKWQVVAER